MGAYGTNYPYGESYYKDEGAPSAPAPPISVGQIGGYAVSFTLAILPTQGVAFSENSGQDYPIPFPGCAGFRVIDEDNNERHIAVCSRDRKLYDMATKNGPGNTSQVQRWKDKQGSDGTGGTDILPRVRFFDDLGTFENFILRNATNHFFGRCVDPAYRGADGYDSDGFITGTEWTMKMFLEGEKLVASRTSDTIPLVSNNHFGGHDNAHRIAIELSANKSGHMITGRKQEYVVTDKWDGDNQSEEDDVADTLATPSRWYSRTPTGFLDSGNGTLVDRITGEILDEENAGSMFLTSGPNGLGPALYCSDRVPIPGQAGSLMFWGKYIDSVSADATPLTLTIQDTLDGFTLYTVDDIPPCTTIYIDHDGVPGRWTETFDIRLFDSNLTDKEIAFYLDNVANHEGDVVLP